MITLPATNDDILAHAIDPALELLHPTMRSPFARLMLLAIGAQESGYRTRVQDNGGPARGFWQTERNGVLAVMHNTTSGDYVFRLARDCGVRYGSIPMYDALETDDVFAAGLARLILWCDPRPLPPMGDIEAAWNCYLRNWRPGKPDPERWQIVYPAALECVEAIA